MPDINLYNMDCMEGLKNTPDKYYELAIVDPPYGIERFKDKSRDGKNKKRFARFGGMANEVSGWDNKPTQNYFDELFRVSQNQIIWGANNFDLPTSEYFCIWDKKQTVDNFASAEYAWVSMGLKMPSKVFEYSIHQHNQIEKIHPTQKPVALYKWLLTKYAKQGDKILDTHLGSGSSAIACYDLGFDLTGYELDKDYYEAMIKRFENHKRQLCLTF